LGTSIITYLKEKIKNKQKEKNQNNCNQNSNPLNNVNKAVDSIISIKEPEIYSMSKETNIACKSDGKNTTGLFLYIVFSILTLGIYSIVWDCMWINRCNAFLARNGKPEGLQMSTYLLTMFLLGPLTLGIMYIVVYCKKLYLQNAVNAAYNELNA
jgi:hypothetical protein